MSEEISFEKFDAVVKDTFDEDFDGDYRLRENWSSMQALLVVSNIDSEYDILIDHEELKSCKTIEDLFKILQSKLKKNG